VQKNRRRFAIAGKLNSSRSTQTLKRLKRLKAVYGAPQNLRRKLGLKRRSLTPSQKLIRMFSR
tara:strand:+ start:290 stop:478 length:189 start_codon:yes stop_codon:yes gene_type:complete